jgi:hypothetical protein
MTPVADKNVPTSGIDLEVLEVVYRSTNEQPWSVARLLRDDREFVGICWSKRRLRRDAGAEDWFLLPAQIGACVLDTARQLNAEKEEEMRRGYEEMANDVEGEEEAMEWIEAHIGECL